ncbi:MAG TPA: Uma2 family endonuclease [Allocoleopsis sp.]
MQAQQISYFSPEEYLELETKAINRSEYINGEIFTMAGGSANHNKITGNFYASLNFAMRGKDYEVYMADVRLWIAKRNIYTYPDVMIISGEPEFALGRKDTITNPLIIAEILSNSTVNYDRGEKFKMYRNIPSFKEYILIAQTEMYIEQFYQNEKNQWVFSEYEGENAILRLKNVDFEISLKEIYDKIKFVNLNNDEQTD